jgi:hypothetical protein
MELDKAPVLLGRDDILKADDRTYEVIPVPEWGGSVRLRSLTGKERDAFEASMTNSPDGKRKGSVVNVRARLAALCIVDEIGAVVFSDSDVRALGNKSAAGLSRVFNKCNEMNGLSEADVAEMTEDFTGDPNGGSTAG